MAWSGRGTTSAVIAIVLQTLAIALVVLRFIARRVILRVFRPSDWFIVVALVFGTASIILNVVQVNNGLGKHNYEIHPIQAEYHLKLVYYTIITYTLCLWAVKISILCLFLEVFSATWIRRTTQVIIVLITVFNVYLFFTNIFFCIPIYAYWNFAAMPDRDPDSWCFKSELKWLPDTGINIISDFVIFFLPLPVVRSMTLPLRQKLWLYFVFAIGFFVCAISIIRCYFLYQQANSDHSDDLYTSLPLATWSAVELSVAIIIACIIPLKPLAARVFPFLISSSGRSGCKGGSRGGGVDAGDQAGGDGNGSSDTDSPPTISSPPPRRIPNSTMSVDVGMRTTWIEDNNNRTTWIDDY